MKKLKYCFLSFALIFTLFLTACSEPNEKQDKVYTIRDKYSITLDTSFFEPSSSVDIEYELFLQKLDIAVYVNDETFESLYSLGYQPESMTAEEYAKEMMRLSGTEANFYTVEDPENMAVFEYTASALGFNFYYFAMVHKGSEEFWITTFYCYQQDKDRYFDQFVDWCSTIKILDTSSTDSTVQ